MKAGSSWTAIKRRLVSGKEKPKDCESKVIVSEKNRSHQIELGNISETFQKNDFQQQSETESQNHSSNNSGKIIEGTSLTRISVKLRWLLTVFVFWDVSWTPWIVLNSTFKCHVLLLNFSWNHPWPFLTYTNSSWVHLKTLDSLKYSLMPPPLDPHVVLLDWCPPWSSNLHFTDQWPYLSCTNPS